jgi:hypothetical protein
VVVFQGLGRDVRLQGVLGIRQCWQGVFHDKSLLGWKGCSSDSALF